MGAAVFAAAFGFAAALGAAALDFAAGFGLEAAGAAFGAADFDSDGALAMDTPTLEWTRAILTPALVTIRYHNGV
ncbi:MAG TPA: hypothetical protein VLZ51_10260 [Brevundimonas sp.]|nr:hypothetical protein [Brevundimonas sp.]HUH24429.1 hypothetical protein [Brevundimonas sp.]